MTNIKKIILLILSIIGGFGILNEFSQINNMGIINLSMFLLLYLIYSKVLEQKNNKRSIIITIIISIIYSLALVIGRQLDTSLVIQDKIRLVKNVIALASFIFPILLLIIKKIEVITFKQKEISKKSKIIYFIIIFIFGFLAYLALYPGVYGYDAGWQILQIIDKEITITNHFSLIYSSLIASLVMLGKNIFNSYMVGFSFITFIQLLLSSVVAYKTVSLCYRKTNNKIILVLSLLFFSLFPTYLVMILSSAQDVLFTIFFTLFVLNIIERIENPKIVFKKSWVISTFLYILLICEIRSNGIYAILFFIPFFILLNQENKKRNLTILCIPIILYICYNSIIMPKIGIEKSESIREIMSIPSQQLARVYNYNINALNDKGYIESLYPNADFRIYFYREAIADYMKGNLNTNLLKKNLNKFVYNYIKTGINDPKNYIEAFLINSLALWYPNKKYNDDQMYHPYLEYDMLEARKWNSKYIEINRKSIIPFYDKLLAISIKDVKWQNYAGIGVIFNLGTYFFLFLFVTFYIIYKKKYKLLSILMIYWGYYLTLLLAPVALIRYGFPFIVGWPIMISIIAMSNEKIKL